ncbi:MAG: cupin domain-containing protein [Microcoleus sp. SM1_3_4]|nr:cupin domain-containing protein [Microcoleus sp. SM1_3_4]
MTAAAIVCASVDRIAGGQPAYSHEVMSLGANSAMPDLNDSQDVTVTVLEGLGSLVVGDRTVTLTPGVFVFVPAGISRAIKVETTLNLFNDLLRFRSRYKRVSLVDEFSTLSR